MYWTGSKNWPTEFRSEQSERNPDFADDAAIFAEAAVLQERLESLSVEAGVECLAQIYRPWPMAQQAQAQALNGTRPALEC